MLIVVGESIYIPSPTPAETVCLIEPIIPPDNITIELALFKLILLVFKNDPLPNKVNVFDPTKISEPL